MDFFGHFMFGPNDISFEPNQIYDWAKKKFTFGPKINPTFETKN